MCPYRFHGAFELDIRVPVPGRLPAIEGILGRERRRKVLFEPLGRVNHRRSRRCVSHALLEYRLSLTRLTVFKVLSIVTDLICAALPCSFLRHVNINKKTKVGLCILVGLGVMCVYHNRQRFQAY